jgi:hypothetical protein
VRVADDSRSPATRLIALRWLLVGLLLGATVSAAGETRTHILATGVLSANDQERDGCYFPIGQHAMLALRPNTPECEQVRQVVGRAGTLLFVLDAAE